MLAEPIRSKKVLDSEQMFYDYFSSASFGTFDFQAIRPTLTKVWTSKIRFDTLNEAESVGPAVVLADYALGETKISTFSQLLDFSDVKDMDALHLYFETHLDQEIILSTHRSEPETHWRHGYVRKPKGFSKVRVTYSSSAEFLEVSWE